MCNIGGLFGQNPDQNKTTSTYTANPVTSQFANTVSATANNLPNPGNVPLQGVQGFSDDQTNAFQGVRNAQGVANPYFSAASNFINQSGSPIDLEAVGDTYRQMANPVFASMNDLFGEQRSQNTGNLVKSAGGVGADRIGVGQAALAKDQALAQGQTGANLYGQALQSYLQQKQLAGGAGALMGNLGGAAQGATYTDLGQLFNAGAQQQGLGQNILTSLYNQQQGQYQNPFQVLGAQQGVLGTLGGALGGNKVDQYPAPSIFSQIAGLFGTGVGAYKAFNQPTRTSATGGRISFASGGFVGSGADVGEIDPYYQAPGQPPSPPPGFPRPMAGGGTASFADRWGGEPDIMGSTEGVTPGFEGVNINLDKFGWGKPVEHGLPLANAEPEQVELPPTANPTRGGPVPFPQAPNPFATGPAPNLPPMPSFPSAPDNGSPVNSPWLALMQAGLGTLAASGQRDSHGLPMSGLAAIGHGGQAGVKTLQEQQAAGLRERQEQVREKQLLEDAAMRRLPYTTMTQEQKVRAAQADRPYNEMTAAQKAADQRGNYQYLGPNAAGDKSVFLNTKTGVTEERPIQVAAKPVAKPIPASLQKDLGEKGASLATLESLNAGFKPEYAGSIVPAVGNLQNWIARQTGIGNTDAADWWSQYAAYRNVVRNKLFGSALTQHEIGEWEKQDINPGMDPKVLTRNLDRQSKVVESALKRRASSLAAQGYSKEAIEAELGHSFGDLGIEKPSTSGTSRPQKGDKKKFTLKNGDVVNGVFDGKEWRPE